MGRKPLVKGGPVCPKNRVYGRDRAAQEEISALDMQRQTSINGQLTPQL